MRFEVDFMFDAWGFSALETGLKIDGFSGWTWIQNSTGGDAKPRYFLALETV